VSNSHQHQKIAERRKRESNKTQHSTKRWQNAESGERKRQREEKKERIKDSNSREDSTRGQSFDFLEVVVVEVEVA
jgi:hypothetical protein